MRNSCLSDWRITVVFHCQILILDGCYKCVSLPLASAGIVRWLDLLLADRSVVCLDVCLSRWPKQASSTHRRRTAQTQPCASSASKSWKAGSRRTSHSKEQLQTQLSLNSIDAASLFMSNCWAFAANDLKDVKCDLTSDLTRLWRDEHTGY